MNERQGSSVIDGFTRCVTAVWRASLSPAFVPIRSLEQPSNDIERCHLAETLNTIADQPMTDINHRFLAAVATTNLELDRQHVPLDPAMQRRLSRNVMEVAYGRRGATLGHFGEVATFVAQGVLAIRSRDYPRLGEAVVGVSANTIGALFTGSHEHTARSLGRR